ncbi:MAG: type II secretion system F family protein [Alphaproteobacteria bacterium]|nr:type II secretion system F family protein [Alphaproteobacteria bacterium]
MGAIGELLRAGDLTTVVIIGAVIVATLAIVLVLVLSLSDEQRRSRRRIAQVVEGSRSIKLSSSAAASLRRSQYETSMPTVELILKQILPRPELLRQRLTRTGRSISIGQYAGACLVVGILAGLIASFLLNRTLPLSILIGIGNGFLLPHLFVAMLTRRRQKVFTDQFPEAIDLIVRGLRSGLPVIESVNVVGREMDKPIGVEFTTVADAVKFGMTLEEALADAVPRIDTAEFKFFVVALAVQRETGGNLAETLENLSDVLRKRRQMKKRIKAMASEPKASAWILGCLPFIMFLIIFFVNTEYVMQLFTDPRGHTLITAGLISQTIGTLIMAKMVRFEI